MVTDRLGLDAEPLHLQQDLLFRRLVDSGLELVADGVEVVEGAEQMSCLVGTEDGHAVLSQQAFLFREPAKIARMRSCRSLRQAAEGHGHVLW